MGRDFFPRGEPEVFRRTFNLTYEASLFELLRAYAGQHNRKSSSSPLQIQAFEIYTVEDALHRLKKMLGLVPDWQDLFSFLPKSHKNPLVFRSAVASTFAASLEMAREGQARIQQSDTFAPIYVKSHIRADLPANDEAIASEINQKNRDEEITQE